MTEFVFLIINIVKIDIGTKRVGKLNHHNHVIIIILGCLSDEQLFILY